MPAQRPVRVLLLDEPFGALDPGIRRDMHELLLALRHETGMTIFMVTHDIAEAFKLGTRLIVFDKIRDGEEAADSAATITYDLPLRRLSTGVADLASVSVRAADALDRTVSILGGETNQRAGETS